MVDAGRVQDGNRQAEMEDIVFHDVYPLHGSSDIRGSSTARNEAIQGDLIEHLTLAGKVLKKASEFQQLPILDELKFYVAMDFHVHIHIHIHSHNFNNNIDVNGNFEHKHNLHLDVDVDHLLGNVHEI